MSTNALSTPVETAELQQPHPVIGEAKTEDTLKCEGNADSTEDTISVVVKTASEAEKVVPDEVAKLSERGSSGSTKQLLEQFEGEAASPLTTTPKSMSTKSDAINPVKTPSESTPTLELTKEKSTDPKPTQIAEKLKLAEVISKPKTEIPEVEKPVGHKPTESAPVKPSMKKQPSSPSEEEVNDEEDAETPDDDEDARNPAYIPRKGAFYMHDSREGESKDVQQDPRKSRADKKWTHDLFVDHQQKPKAKSELVRKYGYDIRRVEKETSAASKESSLPGGSDDERPQRRKNRRHIRTTRLHRPTPQEREQNAASREQAGPAQTAREQNQRSQHGNQSGGGLISRKKGERSENDLSIERNNGERERRSRNSNNTSQKRRLGENRKLATNSTNQREPRKNAELRASEAQRGNRTGPSASSIQAGSRPTETAHGVHFKRTIVSSAHRGGGLERRAPTANKHHGHGISENNNRPGKQYNVNSTLIGNGHGNKNLNNASPTPLRLLRQPKGGNNWTGPPHPHVKITPLMTAPPPPFVAGPGGVPLAVVPTPVTAPPPIIRTPYLHPLQPTNVVYFDPNSQQVNKIRNPPQPRERRRLEIVPPTQ